MKKITVVAFLVLVFFCSVLKQSYSMDMTGGRDSVCYLLDRTIPESVSKKIKCLNKKIKCVWKLSKGTCSSSWFVSKCLGEYFCLLSDEYVKDMIEEGGEPVPPFFQFMLMKHLEKLMAEFIKQMEKAGK